MSVALLETQPSTPDVTKMIVEVGVTSLVWTRQLRRGRTASSAQLGQAPGNSLSGGVGRGLEKLETNMAAN